MAEAINDKFFGPTLEAIASGNTPVQTAVNLGISVASVYRIVRRPDFKSALAEMRATELTTEYKRFKDETPGVIDKLADLIHNAKHESTRLRAIEVWLQEPVS